MTLFASLSAVSAIFDGFLDDENIIEIENMTFNTTNATDFNKILVSVDFKTNTI